MSEKHQFFARTLTLLSGIINLASGLLFAAIPAALIQLLGLDDLHSNLEVRLLGATTAAAGLGLMAASTAALRHWPATLTGTIIHGVWLWAIAYARHPHPIGIFAGLLHLTMTAGLGTLVYLSYVNLLEQRRTVSPEFLKLALRSKTQMGVSLDELARLSPVLVVFVRHFGCSFCREALSDLALARPKIEEQGARLVVVHMGTEAEGAERLAPYGLENVDHISDPNRSLYRAFGIPRGSFGDLFGPKVWWRGFQAAILGRHGLGRPQGDAFQMPGVFLLFHGQVVRSYRHQSAADRPDYIQLVTGNQYASPELKA